MKYIYLLILNIMFVISGCSNSDSPNKPTQEAIITGVDYDSGMTFVQDNIYPSEHKVIVNTGYKRSIDSLSEFGGNKGQKVTISLSDLQEDDFGHGLTIEPQEIEVNIGEPALFTLRSSEIDSKGDHELLIKLNNKLSFPTLHAYVDPINLTDFNFVALYGIDTSDNGEIALMGMRNGLSLLTHDKGRTWKFLHHPYMDEVKKTYVSADGKTMLIGGDKLYASHDSGEHWTRIASELVPGSGKVEGFINDFKVSKNGQVIILGRLSKDKPALLSHDGGYHWHELNFTNPKFYPSLVAISDDGRKILLGELNANAQDDSSLAQVYLSNDSGESWKEIEFNIGLPKPIMRWLHVNMSPDGSIIFVSGILENDSNNRRNIVYQSMDGGLHWSVGFDQDIVKHGYIYTSYIGDGGLIIAGGPNMLVKSTDRKSWHTIDLDDMTIWGYTVEQISADAGEQEILISLSPPPLGITPKAHLLRSFDQGETWDKFIFDSHGGDEVFGRAVKISKNGDLAVFGVYNRNANHDLTLGMYQESEDKQRFYSVF